MQAYIFPGQGSQFPGMGKRLYVSSIAAKKLFDLANELLGKDLTSIMFASDEKGLIPTDIAQLAVFVHAIATIKVLPKFKPKMVAGHSSGELAALVANQVISFEDGLSLVAARAAAMQVACNLIPGSMVAIIGLKDEFVEKICSTIEEVVVPANYNCPGQLVISGSIKGITLACEAIRNAGAKKIIPLKVNGAFHSPLMESACTELKKAISNITFNEGICAIYQNVSAAPVVDPVSIKKNLIQQLISPVQWTQTIQKMIQNGATEFIECGPSNVLQGLVRKINRDVATNSLIVSTPLR